MVFVELCCRSYFSFLEGSSSPEKLVKAAKDLGMTALGLVDRNGLYGAACFYRECLEVGIKPILGAELTIEQGDALTFLCRDLQGYKKLSQLITEAHRGREKGDPLLHYWQLSGLKESLVCVAGRKGSLLWHLVSAGDRRGAEALLERYLSLFEKDDLVIALTQHCEEGDSRTCGGLQKLAQSHGLSTIITNDVCYVSRDDGMLHDVLQCIKQRTTLAASHGRRPANHERYLKEGASLASLFSGYGEAIKQTQTLADACQLSLDFSHYRFPDFPVAEGYSTDSFLAHLVRERLPVKYPKTSEAVAAKVEHELSLISKLKLSGYFLVVWDIVQFARQRGIPVQGRGSAANSIVTYLLDITPVDPVAHRLFLGRFIHEEMKDIPDIDLDFASSRQEDLADREDVIQYIYKRYGADHVAMVCTYVTFQARSAIREVGKVLEMPEEVLDRMARLSGRYEKGNFLEELEKMDEFSTYLKSNSWRHFCLLVSQIADLPRHLGIHVGGMVIASCPIAQLVPLEPARMEGRVVCQWDKDMVGDAGLVKVDILGLGMLAVVREAAQLIESSTGAIVKLDELPVDDPLVYERIASADTIGVFQVESRAQMQSLPRTRPRTFSELGIQVAIIRPGPLQGNMVSPYIRRKRGEEGVRYMHPSLKPILQETLGVILFQEQVLLCAVVAAGFTPSQADALRRAMNRKRSRESMARLRQQFLSGAKGNGVGRQEAEQIFDALEGFALYGFCKSHALSFARLSYISAWLKVYHPAVFLAALLNNQPMGFYPVETLIEDAKRHDVEVLPVDVNQSQFRSLVVDGRGVQLGFRLVKGMQESTADAIAKARIEGPFSSVRNFVKRVSLRQPVVENLIQAGCLDSFGLDRHELLWQLWLVDRIGVGSESLFASREFSAPPLPPSGDWEMLRGEYSTMGFSPKRHPLALLRPDLLRPGVTTSEGLKGIFNHERVTVAGMVVCRQRPPTAKGFAFLTLEDEEGLMNIILSPQVYEASRALFRTTPLLLVEGVCQKMEGLINVRAEKIRPLALTR